VSDVSKAGELPEVTIVMPAYNAAHFLVRTLPAAISAARGGRVIVVDPGSTDNTSQVARDHGVEVLRLPERAGPALARNKGVELVHSEVVLFIDSDCVAHPDVVERVQQAFARTPELVSLTGSYDDSPPEPNFFSQYMNLRHHITHQRAKTEPAGFWAGCGAVRREVFVGIGGFDAVLYPMPMIEDIDLGVRLARHGRCQLDPALHVTHLKHWTMRGVIETDIKSRAIPWGKLILSTGQLPNDLNLRWSQRFAALLAPFVLLGILAAPICALSISPTSALFALLPALVSAVMHRDVLRFMAKRRGVMFSLGYFLFHQVHLFYSAATMAVLTLQHMFRSGSGPAPAGSA
jgi:GT2 family glycosyltransferase